MPSPSTGPFLRQIAKKKPAIATLNLSSPIFFPAEDARGLICLGPRIRSNAGIRVTAVKKETITPKLEKTPNSLIGSTEVKQKDTKPAKVVRAARKTGFTVFRKRLKTRARCSPASRTRSPVSSR